MEKETAAPVITQFTEDGMWTLFSPDAFGHIKFMVTLAGGHVGEFSIHHEDLLAVLQGRLLPNHGM